jgi:DNA-binding transcriptional ArsR family regulator
MNDEHPQVTWDSGTAYDLFISLEVLHQPQEFDLRPSWAAGVRSRVPAEDRKVLEDATRIVHAPLPWIHALPHPKDSAAALWTLRQLPAEERLPALALFWEMPQEKKDFFREIHARRSWNQQDLNFLREAQRPGKISYSPKDLASILDWWSRPAEFGERFLFALQCFHQEFFAEEERRIRPVLEQALEKARQHSQTVSAPDLVEDLSQGVRFTSLAGLQELTLAPSYWSTPLVYYFKLDESRMVMTFGARPPNASLVPGEEVPDALLRGLKALADPTRLRILRYLAGESLTPAELARRLRLRAPTIVHHLRALRMAGLVHLSVEAGGEKRYAARPDKAAGLLANFREYLDLEGQGKM